MSGKILKTRVEGGGRRNRGLENRVPTENRSIASGERKAIFSGISRWRKRDASFFFFSTKISLYVSLVENLEIWIFIFLDEFSQ